MLTSRQATSGCDTLVLKEGVGGVFSPCIRRQRGSCGLNTSSVRAKQWGFAKRRRQLGLGDKSGAQRDVEVQSVSSQHSADSCGTAGWSASTFPCRVTYITWSSLYALCRTCANSVKTRVRTTSRSPWRYVKQGVPGAYLELMRYELQENQFEWHFTIRGPPDTPFEGGIYHGRILLPTEYPLKPPNIVFLTVRCTCTAVLQYAGRLYSRVSRVVSPMDGSR